MLKSGQRRQTIQTLGPDNNMAMSYLVFWVFSDFTYQGRGTREARNPEMSNTDRCIGRYKPPKSLLFLAKGLRKQ